MHQTSNPSSPRRSTLALGICAAALLGACASVDPGAMAKTGTNFTADADMQMVLDSLASLGGKPIENLPAAEARMQPTVTDAVKALLVRQGKSTDPSVLVPGVTSADREIPGPAGALPVRVYTPKSAGPFPVIVYFHGGGWVIADKDVYDGGARGLSAATGAVVVSVDYRLAPEAKFPAAWDDALATYRWATANAASLNGTRKFALAGESAGGNLAVATAVAARDAGLPKPSAILAVYPVGQTGDLGTPSYVDSATAKPLNKAMIGWFVDKLLAKPADATDPRINLVNANLTGLPPTFIINAEIDPLRSDGDLLAAALIRAGVRVERTVYRGVTHEFFGTASVVAKAREAQAVAGERLKKELIPMP